MDKGTSHWRQNLGQTSGEEGQDRIRAREPTGHSLPHATAWPGEERIARERGKRIGPYKGLMGSGGWLAGIWKCDGHDEEDTDGNIEEENGRNNRGWKEEIRNWPGLGSVLKRAVWPNGQVGVGSAATDVSCVL
jgi:hypothetical protein